MTDCAGVQVFLLKWQMSVSIYSILYRCMQIKTGLLIRDPIQRNESDSRMMHVCTTFVNIHQSM